MATVTKTIKENHGSHVSTWSVSLTGSNVTASGSTFIIPMPSASAKYTGANKGYAAINMNGNGLLFTGGNKVAIDNLYWYYIGSEMHPLTRWASGSTKTLGKGRSNIQVNTGSAFNANNKNTKTINYTVDYYNNGPRADVESGKNNTGDIEQDPYYNWGADYIPQGPFGTITLNAPPTCSYTQVQSNTSDLFLKGLTTATVTISSLSAKYGGDFGNGGFCKLTIGSQTASRTSNGNLSIKLNETGTFTPTVSLKDSRGQTRTYSLNPITVINVPIRAKHENQWRYVLPRVKQGGAWKNVSKIFIQQNGTWRRFL